MPRVADHLGGSIFKVKTVPRPESQDMVLAYNLKLPKQDLSFDDMQKSILLSLWVYFITASLFSNHLRSPDVAGRVFEGWHWPVPAGEWQLSNESCNPTADPNECLGFEDKCSYEISHQVGSPSIAPVLAPSRGQIIFAGKRNHPNFPGQAILIEHDDGKTSSLYQLTEIVVQLDQEVEQGEVVGYFNSSPDNGLPLHFFVRPNPVTRECLPIDNLDAIKPEKNTLISNNKKWAELVFTNPPQTILDFLPPLTVQSVGTEIDTRIRITPNQRATIWVLLTGSLADTTRLNGPLGEPSTVIRQTNDGPLFRVHLESFGRLPGSYRRLTFPNSPQANELSFRLNFVITDSINLAASDSVLMTNPEPISPPSYSTWGSSPTLCWKPPQSVDEKPIRFRVKIAGKLNADSGWIQSHCWQPPELPSGLYYWKVIMLDANGFTNRPIQHPLAFYVR